MRRKREIGIPADPKKVIQGILVINAPGFFPATPGPVPSPREVEYSVAVECGT
jgi:hypothetical protein